MDAKRNIITGLILIHITDRYYYNLGVVGWCDGAG